MIALTLGELILVGLHMLTWRGLPPFWAWLFDLNSELALGTVFTSVQYMAVAWIAALIALLAPLPRTWQRLYWLLLALTFALFSVDEYFIIHEPIGEPLWLYIYTAGGILLAGLSVVAYYFGFREERSLFALLLGGLAAMAVGGLGIEALTYAFICEPEFLGMACQRLWIIEEYLEMAGTTLILAAFVSYAWAHLNKRSLRLMKRGAIGLSMLWTLALFANLWLYPAWEANLTSTPIQLTYLDHTLSLLGYHSSSAVASPGDEIELTLYWQAHNPLDTQYRVSVHVLTNLEVDSLTQTDALLKADYARISVPDTAWLPDTTVRQRFRLRIPENLSTPQTCRVMVRVWHREQEVQISQTDRQVIADDTAILFNLPIVSTTPLPDPVTQAGYHFTGGFTLYGYALAPEGTPGDDLPLRFWWQTESDVPLELVQYLHFFATDSDFVHIYDQPPFGGRFPTFDWPGGITLMDEWLVPLSADFPPGEYEVYTGLYAPQSLVRQPVVDDAGQPITNNNIYLGMVSIK